MCSTFSSPVASLLSDTGDWARKMCHASRFASELRTCISTAIPKRKKVAQEKVKDDHLALPWQTAPHDQNAAFFQLVNTNKKMPRDLITKSP